ncbi:MAG: hypothetical protein ACHP6H_06410, partial [Legionellales bacterium]
DEGRLQQHTDLGGHITNYEYNTNGLLSKETSTTGKSINYHYQGDGNLVQYTDKNSNKDEIVNYTYDEEGQVTSKESSRGGEYKDGWIRETDFYQYDALGRLISVRRKTPEDTDTRFPDKDKSLLNLDYEYDAVGNIRHSQVTSNYGKTSSIKSDDYFAYDDNNRMTLNKGQLVNGAITLTSTQGTAIVYDETGNIKEATKYENGYIQKYAYTYDADNRLELVQKNAKNLQTKKYDTEGHIEEERQFNEYGNLSQINLMHYTNGLLDLQQTKNGLNALVSSTSYKYDEASNLKYTQTQIKTNGTQNSKVITHNYKYDLWDAYQISEDEVTITYAGSSKVHGTNRRVYDANGLLQDAIDAQMDGTGNNNTTHYWNSMVDGLRAKSGKEGQTSYLTVAGKTIGDFQLEKNGSQHLNIYTGFTPTGSATKYDADSNAKSTAIWLQKHREHTLKSFLQRSAGDVADGTLPDSPQDNLGTYTLQAGDSLESVALQVYGDNRLWYLIADANGLSGREDVAGGNGQLHIGKRLNIPQVATGQHNTNSTH